MTSAPFSIPRSRTATSPSGSIFAPERSAVARMTARPAVAMLPWLSRDCQQAERSAPGG